MSRRRFGDADDTYKDFISAIDDHKRKRAAQHAAAAQLMMQQQAQAAYAAQQQQQAAARAAYVAEAAAAAATSGPDPSAVGGYQSGPYDPYSVEDDYSTALPVNAMDRESWPPAVGMRRAGSIMGGGGGGGGVYMGVSSAGGINSGSGPLGRSGGTIDDEQPLLFEDRGGGVIRKPAVGDASSSDHAWISKRNMDLVVQRKSMYILANGMFGVLLMVSILQICWDPMWQTRRYGVDMTAPADYYSDIDFVANRLQLQPQPLPRSWSWQAISQECPSPARSYVTEAMKILLTLSTLILCWQILDRKRMQVNIKFREQRRKLKLKGHNAERDGDRDDRYLNMSGNVSNLGLLSLSAGMFRWELWLSLIVCLIQPIPFTQQLTGGLVSDKIGLLMWLRLHLLFRVIRDTSEIWLARRSIKHQSAFQTKVPLFDWWLACKTVCYRDPLFFAGCFYLLSILLFAHALYIAERDLLPRFFDIWTSLFVSLQIVSVGWPADVWEIYMPITVLGKLVSLMAGMAGLLLISFVIASVAQTLYPTKFEENALNFIAMDKVRQKEREGSARLIQYVWKNAAREAELEAKLAPKNPALYEELAEHEEKVFMENFIAKSKELRTIRRERAELEERSDPTSERNISPMDQYFDTKLEAIRTDIQHQSAKNSQQFMNVVATLNQLLHKTIKEAQREKTKAQAQAASAAAAAAHASGVPQVAGSRKGRAASRAARGSTAAGLPTVAIGVGTGSDLEHKIEASASPLPPSEQHEMVQQQHGEQQQQQQHDDDEYRLAVAQSLAQHYEREAAAEAIASAPLIRMPSQPQAQLQQQSAPLQLQPPERVPSQQMRRNQQAAEEEQHSDEGQPHAPGEEQR